MPFDPIWIGMAMIGGKRTPAAVSDDGWIYFHPTGSSLWSPFGLRWSCWPQSYIGIT